MSHRKSVQALALFVTIPALLNMPIDYAQGARVLEQVVVTARKRVENLQETPIAITAISGDMIDQTNMISVADIEQPHPTYQLEPQTMA